MERQLLEILDAFNIFADDSSVKNWTPRADSTRWSGRKMDTEDRLRTVERQKEDLEDHLLETAMKLRKLQKTPVVRFIRFLRRLNPLRSSRE